MSTKAKPPTSATKENSVTTILLSVNIWGARLTCKEKKGVLLELETEDYEKLISFKVGFNTVL